MTHSDLPWRVFSAGVGALAVLALAVPVPAAADPAAGVDVGAARNRIDLPPADPSVDLGAARNRIDLSVADIRRLLDMIEQGTLGSTPAPRT